MIEVNDITKMYKIPERKSGLLHLLNQTYREVIAVKQFQLQIKKGELVAVLGANGAGKSTFIKLCCGILTPTAGNIRINGFVPSQRKHEFLKEIGIVMANRSSLVYDLPVKDSFQYLRKIYQMKDRDYDIILNQLIDKIQLKQLLDTPVRKLSLGQRRKAEIIAAIVHNPKVLFLDEPTLGLDIKSKLDVLEFIQYLQRTYATTILLTTHDLNDVERICERMIFIDSGSIIYDGKTADFNRADNRRNVTISLQEPLHDLTILQDYPFIQQDDLNYSFYVTKQQVLAVLKRLDQEYVDEIIVKKITLEESVLNYERANLGGITDII